MILSDIKSCIHFFSRGLAGLPLCGFVSLAIDYSVGWSLGIPS